MRALVPAGPVQSFSMRATRARRGVSRLNLLPGRRDLPDCLTNTPQIMQGITLGLQSGALYAVIAIGYTLVYGVLELLNFAHSEIFTTGAFAATFVGAGFLGEDGAAPKIGRAHA